MTGALLPFTYEDNGLSISGFLGKPELNRSNRNFETYFVNGRYVRNDILTKAVEEGYKAYLMQHKFPFFVLHFTMAPDMLDVNVHPAKMEIRLIRGSELYEQISKAVAVKLGERELIPDIKLTEEEKEPKQVPKTPEPFEIRRSAMVMEERGEYRTAAATKELPREPKAGELLQKVVQNRVIGNENAVDIAGNEGIHANVIKAKDHILVEKPSQLNLFEEKFLTREAKNEYRILGQIFDTYWLVAFKDKLFIVDQHAAHEKVKYERLVKELEEKKISSQMLNPPVILTLSGREETLVFEYRSYFKELGFEIEDFGGSSVAVRSMPVDLYGCDEKELFTDILDELSENEAKGTPAVILHKLASMACKSAVKGNNKLDQKEMETLLEELFTLDNPYHCPHGRPTIISMSKYEIEKKFKRII